MKKQEIESLRELYISGASLEEIFDFVYPKIENLKHAIIHRSCIFGHEKEDLMAMLDIVLLKCIENFDYNRKVKFTTYYYNSCNNYIWNLMKCKNKKSIIPNVDFDKIQIISPKETMSRIDILKKASEFVDGFDFLNEEEKFVLKHRLEGYSYEDISIFLSDELEVSPTENARVRVIFNRVKKKIKDKKVNLFDHISSDFDVERELVYQVIV